MESKPYYAIKALMPPTVVTFVSGERYAISGSVWIKIDESVTQKMVEEAWEPLYPRKAPESLVSEEKVKEYTVRTYSSGRVTCTCPGFEFRKKCRHVEKK